MEVVPGDKAFVSINNDIFSQSNSVTPYFNKSINVSVDTYNSETVNSAHHRFHMTRPETISRIQCQAALNNKSWDRQKAKEVEAGWS